MNQVYCVFRTDYYDDGATFGTSESVLIDVFRNQGDATRAVAEMERENPGADYYTEARVLR